MFQIARRHITPNAKKTAVFYVGSFTSSIFNYLFHLLLLRLLAPEAYGEFLSYVSFLYLITIPAETVSTFVIKHVADSFGKHDHKAVNKFFYLTLGKIILPSAILSILVIVSSNNLAVAFKAHNLAFVILGIHAIVTFLSAIVSSYLLAFQGYIYNVFAGLVGVVIKIILAYILITSGTGAIGGVVAILMAGIFTTTVVFLKIKPAVYPPVKDRQPNNFKIGGFLTYSLIFSAGSLSLISTDVLLVRYLFEPHTSGLFSALSVLTRMIYFGLAPLSVLMLPMVTARFSAGVRTRAILYKLGSVNLFLGAIGVAIFSTMPTLVVQVLSGPQYLGISGLLTIAAVSILMFSLSRLLLLYLMSVGHPQANLFFLAALVMQPILISLYHGDLQQILFVNLATQFCLLASLLMYYKIALKRVE